MTFLSDLLFALVNGFLEALLVAPINILADIIVAIASGALV